MLIRLVDRLTEETLFQPLPGVLLSSNRTKVLQESLPDSKNDLKDLDNLLYSKVSGYFHSLTISVHPLELNSTDLVDTVTGISPILTRGLLQLYDLKTIIYTFLSSSNLLTLHMLISMSLKVKSCQIPKERQKAYLTK